MELTMELTAKLTKASDTAKRFFNSEFEERIAPYKAIIRKVRMAEKTQTLEATISCLELPSIKGDGMAAMMLLAAAVEIIREEPP